VSQTLNAVRMVEFRPGYERFIGNICAKKMFNAILRWALWSNLRSHFE